jgi:RNA-directed DNA polymerase
VICSQTFRVCNRTTYCQLARWGQARHHGKKGKRWTWDKYTIEVDGRRRFGMHIKDEEGKPKPLYVKDHTDTHSRDHTKVRGQASPYDGNLIYWSKRLQQHPLMGSRRAKLLAIQKGQCPRCGLYFQDGDILEIDHAIPTALGGRDTISNQWVYHRHCHDEKTAEDLAMIAKHKAAGIHHK